MNKVIERKRMKEATEMAAGLVGLGITVAGIGIFGDFKTSQKIGSVACGALMIGTGMYTMNYSVERCAQLYSEMDAAEKVAARIDDLVDDYKKTQK